MNGSDRFRLSRLARAMALLATAVMLTGLIAVPGRADTASQLAHAQAKLNRLLADIRAATKQKDALQTQLNALAAKISQVQAQVEQVSANIVQLQQEISDTTDQQQAQQGVLNERARLAYESGPVSPIEFLLSSTSIGDLQDRIEIMNAAAASDEGVIVQLQNIENQLSAKQADWQALQAVLAQKQAKLTKAGNELQGKFSQQNAIVSQLQNARSQAEAIVSKLKKKLQQQYQQQLGGGGHGGGIAGVFLTCPVRGPHGYSDDFGAPRYTTNPPHPHAGNDIFSPRGTPIVAPFPGTATDASGGLGGLAVNVSGPLGYVYNAHLDRIGTLGAVTTGTIIGYVGSTGDAQGGQTHDHFEWHPSVVPAHAHVSPYGFSVIGTAIDPFPYLNSVC